MTDAFKEYFNSIKGLDAKDATEHTLRGALENLLKAVAKNKNPAIKVIHEPKRDKGGKGAPDYKFKLTESILGYLENKKIDEDLNSILKSAQIAKYKQLTGNLIVTNYLEWVWLRDGAIHARETLCYPNDVGSRKAKLDPDKAEKVGLLLEHFYSTPPQHIARAKDLALALATRCHDLRDSLLEELLRQQKEHNEGRLWSLYSIFKKEVFHELEVKEFADAFAQTLAYGLFLARLNMEKQDQRKLTLENAKDYIPASFELIRELVNFLDELKKDEYLLARQPVDEILSIMNTLDVAAIHEDLAFTKRQGKLLKDTEEERLLFAKDPYIYFYEDFLKAFDAAMRKGRGVYYTPPPVVNFIVRAINDILKKDFGIPKGLADSGERVTVLDFATGTGTFLVEILQQIFDDVSEGVRDKVIERVLKNLYGFEYLIAPYTIAHLKLSQFLQDKDYPLLSNERLKIYLTNTLEPIEIKNEQYVLGLLPALSREVKEAQGVKDKKILVITGNPPYSGHSKNTGSWIRGLIEAYKRVDGKPLGEKNSKWLQDDYVKFIRFAQWKMDQVDEGVVGIITNHSFLDNPTFRGMRQSLMNSFDRIYVLDLHGNAKKKETAPDGSKDENVFDIEQGVAISLLVKKGGLKRGIFHADLYGSRKAKYRELLDLELHKTEWSELTPNTPHYLFIPQDEVQRVQYEKGWSIKEIFIESNTGTVSKRDHIAFQFERKDLLKVLSDFSDLTEGQLREKYDFKESRDGKLPDVQKHVQSYGIKEEYIQPCLYRPFDRRWTYFTNKSKGFLGWPVYDTMRHMLAGENTGIITTRLTKDNWSVLATDSICGHKSASRYDISYLFPLYLYSFPERGKTKLSLFDDEELFRGKERIENLAPDFRQFIDSKYSKHYEPEQILGYIYAVLHSPTYRSKYIEFLKIDFPRIPFVEDRKTFEKLSALGWELVQAHLLKDIPATPKVDINKGSDLVEKPVYEEKQRRLYFNRDQYFSPVPQNAWEFHIGGYQVLDKYLKSRKGRTLTLDEIENVQNVVKVLAFTSEQMQRIDAVWKP